MVVVNFPSLIPLMLISIAFGSPLWASEGVKGKNLYASCAACHGVKGEGMAPLKAPPLGGREPWYLEAQLKKYLNGQRGADPRDVHGMQMAQMAKVLRGDADLREVVQYIQTFPAPMPTATFKGDLKKGHDLYQTCIACHGNRGQGNPHLKSPSLRALPDWYLVMQLQKFKSGWRGTHAKDVHGQQMRTMSMHLADEGAMKDVAAYILSLQKP